MTLLASATAENYAWACTVLRKAMESGTWGNVTFSMQNGVIGNVKTETNEKPPVDNARKPT